MFLIAERVLLVRLATPALLTLHLFVDPLPIASDRFWYTANGYYRRGYTRGVAISRFSADCHLRTA